MSKTNRERAEDLVRFVRADPQCVFSIERIEDALDLAEKRGRESSEREFYATPTPTTPSGKE